MNPTSKKFIALFLAFSLMAISCTTMTTQRQKRFESSKERLGAELIITKKDGQQIRGELIAVKPNSLLLLNTDGKDVSVKIEEIKTIRVVKKSKVGLGAGIGAGIGFVIGAGLATICNLSLQDYDRFSWFYVPLFGAICSLPSLLIGGVTGALLGTDKTIQIEGMSDLGIQIALDKLRKKARIRDYK